MVQFITLGHSVLDTQSDYVVNHVYQHMPMAPVLWLEQQQDTAKVAKWCQGLYPRRLLLHKHLEPTEMLQHGVLYLASVEQLHTLSTPIIVYSRGVCIPEALQCVVSCYWVDDDREHNRENYRNYQKRGIKPHSLKLDAGNLQT